MQFYLSFNFVFFLIIVCTRHTMFDLQTEIREMKERTEIEKQTWEENYRKKQENYLMQRERELKENVKKDRNKEIELVIRQLEEDATSQREDCERVAENRIKYV